LAINLINIVAKIIFQARVQTQRTSPKATKNKISQISSDSLKQKKKRVFGVGAAISHAEKQNIIS
jgi:hypothetical protein